jgi:hypothetical protein
MQDIYARQAQKQANLRAQQLVRVIMEESVDQVSSVLKVYRQPIVVQLVGIAKTLVLQLSLKSALQGITVPEETPSVILTSTITILLLCVSQEDTVKLDQCLKLNVQ